MRMTNREAVVVSSGKTVEDIIQEDRGVILVEY